MQINVNRNIICFIYKQHRESNISLGVTVYSNSCALNNEVSFYGAWVITMELGTDYIGFIVCGDGSIDVKIIRLL